MRHVNSRIFKEWRSLDEEAQRPYKEAYAAEKEDW
jgi:hypothetical protein